MALMFLVIAFLTSLQLKTAAAAPPVVATTAAQAEEQAAKIAAWMERNDELRQRVSIENLRLVGIVGANGEGIAVVGRAVNHNEVSLSLLAIHVKMSGQSGPGANFAILRQKGDTIAAGAMRDFGFVLDASATSELVPLDPMPAQTSAVSEEEARRLGDVSAYVTYAGE